MVDAGVLGARIASSAVAPLVRKLFVKDQPGAGLVSSPVRISALVPFGREKRSVTPKDVEKVAAELVWLNAEPTDPDMSWLSLFPNLQVLRVNPRLPRVRNVPEGVTITA
ncbi:hypothetical protein AB0H92_33490 [Streptomyces phaeochromogenes]|uniref:NACHT N-terminal Helical domain 1-containing protein n=1 Tax=Streptomyces phaeochromogenes TaxID=1923 RepID=UPI00340E5624